MDLGTLRVAYFSPKKKRWHEVNVTLGEIIVTEGKEEEKVVRGDSPTQGEVKVLSEGLLGAHHQRLLLNNHALTEDLQRKLCMLAAVFTAVFGVLCGYRYFLRTRKSGGRRSVNPYVNFRQGLEAADGDVLLLEKYFRTYLHEKFDLPTSSTRGDIMKFISKSKLAANLADRVDASLQTSEQILYGGTSETDGATAEKDYVLKIAQLVKEIEET